MFQVGDGVEQRVVAVAGVLLHIGHGYPAHSEAGHAVTLGQPADGDALLVERGDAWKAGVAGAGCVLRWLQPSVNLVANNIEVVVTG